jgi:hypothetical protein
MMTLIVLVVARELLAGQLRHVDFGKYRRRADKHCGGENRRVEGLHLAFLLHGAAAVAATLAVLLVASKKS